MLENESNEMPDIPPSSSSAAEGTESGAEGGNSEDSDLELFEAAYRSILDELIDDAMWEVCFEVHRAAKLGYSFLELPEEEFKPVEDSEKDIFGQKLKSKVQNFQISCPMCKNKSCATKFASHLAKCIGISGRNSSRAASKKIAASNVFIGSDIEDENDDYDSDSSYNANKKRSKKSQAKKTSRRKAKVQGNNLSKSVTENANYQEMTYEQRKAFFQQKCGVISKRTNKMCMNPHKCSQHTDEQRRDVRHSLLRDMGDQLTSDGQIDVDTVDEGSGAFSFASQSLPTSSAASASGVTAEKKATTPKSNTGQFKKKNSTNSVDNPTEVMPAASSLESA